MKFATVLPLLLSTSFASAEKLRLQNLNCRALNGGTLEATGRNGAALIVEGTFGFSQKKYIGRISELNESGSRFVLLNNEGMPELEVRATIDLEIYGVQTVPATISFANNPFLAVGATCEIQVNPYK